MAAGVRQGRRVRRFGPPFTGDVVTSTCEPSLWRPPARLPGRRGARRAATPCRADDRPQDNIGGGTARSPARRGRAQRHLFAALAGSCSRPRRPRSKVQTRTPTRTICGSRSPTSSPTWLPRPVAAREVAARREALGKPAPASRRVAPRHGDAPTVEMSLAPTATDRHRRPGRRWSTTRTCCPLPTRDRRDQENFDTSVDYTVEARRRAPAGGHTSRRTLRPGAGVRQLPNCSGLTGKDTDYDKAWRLRYFACEDFTSRCRLMAGRRADTSTSSTPSRASASSTPRRCVAGAVRRIPAPVAFGLRTHRGRATRTSGSNLNLHAWTEVTSAPTTGGSRSTRRRRPRSRLDRRRGLRPHALRHLAVERRVLVPADDQPRGPGRPRARGFEAGEGRRLADTTARPADVPAGRGHRVRALVRDAACAGRWCAGGGIPSVSATSCRPVRSLVANVVSPRRGGRRENAPAAGDYLIDTMSTTGAERTLRRTRGPPPNGWWRRSYGATLSRRPAAGAGGSAGAVRPVRSPGPSAGRCARCGGPVRDGHQAHPAARGCCRASFLPSGCYRVDVTTTLVSAAGTARDRLLRWSPRRC